MPNAHAGSEGRGGYDGGAALWRRVEALVRQVLAEEGLEVVAVPGGLRTADGRVFGLSNIAARCRAAPTARWRRIVTDQVRSLLAVDGPKILENLSREEALRGVCLRVVDRTTMSEDMLTAYTYPRVVGGDLVEMFVLTVGQTAIRLRDCDVEKVGIDDLRTAATENLRRMPRPRFRTVEWPHRVRVHVLEGDGHTASRVLLLPDVLRRTLGHADVPAGVLVAIPTKYELWLHPIEDYRAYGAYVGLFDVACGSAYTDPGGLTPHVYWWRDGALVQIMTERDGMPHPDDGFIKTVARVAEADERK